MILPRHEIRLFIAMRVAILIISPARILGQITGDEHDSLIMDLEGIETLLRLIPMLLVG
jgi:hypothetical protein